MFEDETSSISELSDFDFYNQVEEQGLELQRQKSQKLINSIYADNKIENTSEQYPQDYQKFQDLNGQQIEMSQPLQRNSKQNNSDQDQIKNINNKYQHQIIIKDLLELSAQEISLLSLYKIFSGKPAEIEVLQFYYEQNPQNQINQDFLTLLNQKQINKRIQIYNKLFILCFNQFIDLILYDYDFIQVLQEVYEKVDKFFLKNVKFYLIFDQFIHILKEQKYSVLKVLINFSNGIIINITEIPEKVFLDKSLNKYIKILQKEPLTSLKNIIIYYQIVQKNKPIVKQLLYDIKKTEEEYKYILINLIKFKRNEFAQDIFKGFQLSGVSITKEYLDKAIDSDNFQIMYFLYKENNKQLIHNWLNFSEIQSKLIRKLLILKNFDFEILLFFIIKINEWQDKYALSIISEIFLEFLEKNNEQNIFYTFTNPIKIICLIYEILNNSLLIQNYAKGNIMNCLTQYMIFLYIDQIEDTKILNNMLQDKDLNDRRILFIIQQNKIESVIKNVKFQDQVEQIYNGDIACHFSYIKYSSIVQNVMYQRKTIDLTDEYHMPVLDDSITDQLFIFSKEYWMNNCKQRALLEFFFLCAFYIIFLVLFAIFIQINNSIKIKNLQNIFLQEDYDKFQQAYGFFKYFTMYFYINICCFQISNRIYYKTQNMQEEFTIDQKSDMIMFILMIVQDHMQKQVFQNILDQTQIPPSQETVIKIIQSFAIIFFTKKIVVNLKVLKAFAIFIQTLLMVFKYIIDYLVIFFTVISFFIYMANLLQIFQVRLYQHPLQTFKYLHTSFYYLFEALFGQFDTSIYLHFRPIIGPGFLILFLLIVAVIFFNLLVAMLTVVYEISIKNSEISYYLNLIENIRQTQYVKNYGPLVLMPLPLSIVNILYLMIKLILKKQHQDILEKIFIIIAYSPILATNIIIFILMNLFFLPIFYIKHIIILMSINMKTAFKWIFKGILLIIKKYIFESRIFIKILFMQIAINNIQFEEKLSKRTFIYFYKYLLNNYAKNKKEMISSQELIEGLQQYNEDIDKQFQLDDLQLSMNPINKKKDIRKQVLMSQKLGKQTIIKNIHIDDPNNLIQFLPKICISNNPLNKQKTCVLVKNFLQIIKKYKLTNFDILNFDTLQKTLNEYNKTE